MKIITVLFNNSEKNFYTTLSEVFKYSVKKHMPDIDFIEIRKNIPANKTGRPDRYYYNTEKLKIWVEELEKSEDNIIFCDCDLLMVNHVYDAFEHNFDIAYTETTTNRRVPFNCGVMFARPTDKARSFFNYLLYVNNKMLEDREFHKKYEKKYLGINQAALGYVLEDLEELKVNNIFPKDLKIHKYKSNPWNAVNCDWNKINIKSETRFIHFKGPLRKALLGKLKSYSEWNYILKLWNDTRKEMLIKKRSVKT